MNTLRNIEKEHIIRKTGIFNLSNEIDSPGNVFTNQVLDGEFVCDLGTELTNVQSIRVLGYKIPEDILPSFDSSNNKVYFVLSYDDGFDVIEKAFVFEIPARYFVYHSVSSPSNSFVDQLQRMFVSSIKNDPDFGEGKINVCIDMTPTKTFAIKVRSDPNVFGASDAVSIKFTEGDESALKRLRITSNMVSTPVEKTGFGQSLWGFGPIQLNINLYVDVFVSKENGGGVSESIESFIHRLHFPKEFESPEASYQLEQFGVVKRKHMKTFAKPIGRLRELTISVRDPSGKIVTSRKPILLTLGIEHDTSSLTGCTMLPHAGIGF